ncbi:hypothetical protein BSKO_12172 [Bryopsis sp. KO-2023]|nr:hypothetical protein BSKO_12172 [Bryopsis sp. KO-2023]
MSTVQDSDLGGLILPITRGSFGEILSKKEIDVHNTHFQLIFSNAIKPGLPLFIFVCEERNLYGCFAVQSQPYEISTDLGPVARVPFATTTPNYFYADEASFSQYISNNYYGEGRFRLGVTPSQANALTYLLMRCPVPFSILGPTHLAPLPTPPSSHVRTSTVPPRTGGTLTPHFDQVVGWQGGFHDGLIRNASRLVEPMVVVQDRHHGMLGGGGWSKPAPSDDVQPAVDQRNMGLQPSAHAMKIVGGGNLHGESLSFSESNLQPPGHLGSGAPRTASGTGFWQPGVAPAKAQQLVGMDSAKWEDEAVEKKRHGVSIRSNFGEIEEDPLNSTFAETTTFVAAKGPKEVELEQDDFEINLGGKAREWKSESKRRRPKPFNW